MTSKSISEFVNSTWDDSIVPSLVDYIRIPNKSPLFDPDWEANGHMEKAVTLIADWCRAQEIEGLTVEVHRIEGKTPVILMEVPGTSDSTVLLYGHLDKQPEMTGWAEDLGPWKPVMKGDRLYGRGGADDGYSAFASLTAIRALQREGIPHARCVVLIEACEESGSADLPAHIDALQDRIGSPDLVICLDSGAGNYDQMWCTTSLRGLVLGELRVDCLAEGVHSGDGSGVVASSFRIARQLLSRIENAETGEIFPEAFNVEIPEARIEQAGLAAKIVGEEMKTRFPFVDSMRPVTEDTTQLVLNRTWRPALSVTGSEGLPSLTDAGNVLRPYTTLKLSLRVPPTCDVDEATRVMEKLLTEDPPYGARVSFVARDAGPGWEAPAVAPWVHEAANEASMTYFGREVVYMGEGGSIPFMGMLGEKFPEAQFLITGVLGPASNAHGPNEFLHIPCGKKLTACVAHVLAKHYEVKA